MNQKYEHTFRITKSTWGIFIKIIAEYTSLSKSDDKTCCTQITPNLYALFEKNDVFPETDGLLDEEIPFLWRGLELVEQQIEARTPY